MLSERIFIEDIFDDEKFLEGLPYENNPVNKKRLTHQTKKTYNLPNPKLSE